MVSVLRRFSLVEGISTLVLFLSLVGLRARAGVCEADDRGCGGKEWQGFVLL